MSDQPRRPRTLNDARTEAEAAFKRAYFRAYGPRGALHFYAGAGIALVLTFPALAIAGEVWELFWRLSGEPRAYAPNSLIWQFFLFFTAPAFWAVITHAALRRYHRNRPRELRKEIAREKADALTTSTNPSSG